MFEPSDTIVSRPKSARQAWPDWSIRILAFVYEVHQRERERPVISKTHPFQIPVDHSLIVHMDQSPCDISQLPESQIINGDRGATWVKQGTHKLKPVLVRMRHHKLVDVPVRHPLRHHNEPVISHHHPQQW